MSEALEKFEILNVLGTYMQAYDINDIAAMLAMVTEDVDWKMGSARSGKHAVAEALASRPSNRCARHLIFNPVITAAQDDYHASFIIFGIARVIADGEAAPYSFDGAKALGDCTARFVRDGEGWLISELKGNTVFYES